MYVEYCPKDDSLFVMLKAHYCGQDRELAPGVTGIYSKAGELVGLEIASGASTLIDLGQLQAVGLPRVLVQPPHEAEKEYDPEGADDPERVYTKVIHRFGTGASAIFAVLKKLVKFQEVYSNTKVYLQTPHMHKKTSY